MYFIYIKATDCIKFNFNSFSYNQNLYIRLLLNYQV